ncbi:MAG: Double-strand break repair protein AddB [Hyphomicrobiales bacterium]|nr:Double-strand break repair protein AddB [Hyphomicrobiales bacterium]
MSAARAPRILTIHPGSPFLATFAEAFLAGRVVPGIGPHTGPLDLAAATIYVPTRRAARALTGELARRLPGPAALLPQIVPLGHLETIETSLLFEPAGLGDGPIPGIPDAISDIERRMALTRLVLAWADQLAHAITHVEGGTIRTDRSEALLVTRAPAQAWHLAGDLAGLIDEMIVEDADWTGLRRLAPEEFDRYWSITLDFLKIASEFWPAHLAERQRVDAATRQILLVDSEIARLAGAGAGAPVIAIGSTGTNRATARLLAAIARLDQGAVVLPGLDQTLDPYAWAIIPGDMGRHIDPSAGHPQSALRRLLPVLQIERDDVEELGNPDPIMAIRQRLLSEAFRPADTTEAWPAYLASVAPEDLRNALADITMVTAADEREEALALALRMRETLETPGRTAALVTPDRALARRVRAELARWNVEIDDSGGEPLAASSYGVLARLVLACLDKACMPAEWLALLAHPLVRFGASRSEIERLSGLLEIGVLRGVVADRDDPAAMVATARVNASGHHAHPAARRIADRDWEALDALVTRLTSALAPLRNVEAKSGLPIWIAAHRASLASLIDPGEGKPQRADEAAETLERLFAELATSADAALKFRAIDYRAFLDLVTRETVVRGPVRAHPRLKILGLLEARLIDADLMLLAGLDETIWPPQTTTDAFLNRPMRAELGLSAPERRIGQTAHDFTQCLGTRDVVISRATKRGGSPTVPSRFLQRLEALAGPAFAECRTRGDRLIALVRRLDRPERIAPIARPQPRPALELRPQALSVTEIETLRRDPYAIYARRILKLEPLEDLGARPGAREAGTQLHDVLGAFVTQHASGDLPSNALEQLRALAQEKLADLLRDPDYRAFQWPRIEASLGLWLEWDQERRPGLADISIEADGRLAIALDDGTTFTLRGRADRIERRTDGACVILDYKSGRIPSAREIAAGFAPQLPLEVTMLEQGAFATLGASPVADACHVKIGTTDAIEPKSVAAKDRSLAETAEQNYAGLVSLLNELRLLETPYLSRPFPQFASRFSSYDHLARVKEWSAGSGEGDDA